MRRSVEDMAIIKKQIINLQQEGLSKRAIAKKLNVSRNIVLRVLGYDNPQYRHTSHDPIVTIKAIISKYHLDWLRLIQHTNFNESELTKFKAFLSDSVLHKKIKDNKCDPDYIIFLLFSYYNSPIRRPRILTDKNTKSKRIAYETLFTDYIFDQPESNNYRGRSTKALLTEFIKLIDKYVIDMTGTHKPELLCKIVEYHPDWTTKRWEYPDPNPINRYLKKIIGKHSIKKNRYPEHIFDTFKVIELLRQGKLSTVDEATIMKGIALIRSTIFGTSYSKQDIIKLFNNIISDKFRDTYNDIFDGVIIYY